VTLSYTYDRAGAQLSETGPDGTTTYAYDADSRLVTLTAPGSQAYGFGYDAAGRLSSETRPDGVADTLSYDAAGELTGRTSRLGSTVVAQANYTYDAGGLRTSLTDLGGTHTYTYDAAGELLGATHPASSGLAAESYTYNASGDRVSSASDPAGSIHFDAGGHLTADATHSYTYDAEGDVVSSTLTATGATTAYSWDADHRLLGVTHPDGSTSHYTYDGLGRRIAVQDPAATTRYVYDGSNVHLEYNGSNALQAAYAETLTLGGVIAQTRGSQNLAYAQDGLGSTTALLDGSGNVAAAYGYDSFGRQAPSNPSSPQQAFSYTGQTYDASTGLYYDRARYYDPGTGRFLSEDPVQHANRYAYVGNDPTNLVDPSGAQELVEESETIAIDEEIDAAAVEEEQSALCEEGSILGKVLGEGLSANEKGSLAENYVSKNFLDELPKNTEVLDGPSGSGRIPDFINANRDFFEVKNVGYLSYTRQLQDFVALQESDNPLTIFVRGSTRISGPLQDAADAGKLNLVKCLPG
jgi:RHS repeat-associated protein